MLLTSLFKIVRYSIEYDKKDIEKQIIHRNQKKTYRMRRLFFNVSRKQELNRIPRRREIRQGKGFGDYGRYY